ncbi:hypothetical protein [Deinococcus peraridilitoris]|uniref:Uncharacterized protein n=1 Tax=Deinococcus peraridilitoris (strain DSM 19664 / LMG 22246 / CIP 109416 / KR-200) TaxID=937777 RepID=L0A1F5_DEIPD|nr:hypothetical protein [Deinococcus peraridilitoris]AFZ67284.1 hypothetical protein Deipe_1765 [Deinococcus peraridilitoris DSM 19664]
MRVVTTVLLAVLGAVFASLTLAAFASVNPSVSDALRLLSTVEGTLATRLGPASFAFSDLDGFWRGLIYLGITTACIWLAAYLKPRGA